MGVEMSGPKLIIKLGSRKKFNRRLYEMPAIQRNLDKVTRRLEGQAKGQLARHRKTGDHRVFVVTDRHTRIIILESTSGQGSPMSVQFGHHLYGKWVHGLYILPGIRSRNDG